MHLKEALNDVEDAFGIGKDVVVPEPDHAIPMLPQPRSAVLIGARLIGVLAAVELNDQQRFHSSEIRDVRPDRHLAAKLDAVELSIAEMLPKLLFRFSRLLPQLSGASLR